MEFRRVLFRSGCGPDVRGSLGGVRANPAGVQGADRAGWNAQRRHGRDYLGPPRKHGDRHHQCLPAQGLAGQGLGGMIARILGLSVRERWAVAFITFLVVLFGAWQITLLPIDAVPDVTNRQVQINSFVPTLGPVNMEKQVTFPVETALAGIPGLQMTRSDRKSTRMKSNH